MEAEPPINLRILMNFSNNYCTF